MSADWKAGDKALCVSDNWDYVNVINDNPPKRNGVYLVTDVVSGKNLNGTPDIGLFISGSRCWHRIKRALWFDGKAGEMSWTHKNFRKLVPACDRASHEREASL